MADNLEIDGDDRPVTSQGGRTRPSPRKRWIRRTLTIAIALGAIGGFGFIVLNAYDRDAPPDDKAAPVIRADAGPTKVRPEAPGGMQVPNQDKQIYGRIAPADGRPQVERLIPPPEATVSRPPSPPPPPVSSPPASSPAAASPSIGSLPAAPQPSAPGPAAGAAPPPPAPPLAPPPQARPAPEPPKLAPPKTEPNKTAARTPAPAARGAAGSGYRVQIAALRSEEAAKRAWATLSKSHGDLFGKLESRLVRADLGAKGVYWRLQAGPLASAEAAQALCNRAKQRKLGCLVVKP